MAAAVATTAVVQTGLDGLALTAREESARAFGADTFVLARVATGNLSRRELADRLARNPNITRSDARFLEIVADGRVRYAATAQRSADVNAGRRTFENATVNGTRAALFDLRDIDVESGRVFTADEDARNAQVLVAGRAIVDALFPGTDPVGRQVRLAGRAFTIVGVQVQQGSAGGVSLDRYIWMPLGAFERAFGAPPSLQIFAAAPEGASEATLAAEDRARISMRARRHLGPGAADTFDIITPEASRTFVGNITERIGAAGPPLSLMALIAAMVVVANTTLVSVTQRTREIGIRRALGATRASILAETLAESLMVATVGGALGLAVGAVVLRLAGSALSIALPLEWATGAGSLVAAAISGLVAGWYPARRAAALDVVDALRQE
jgi:putative ABC transport system permease protein